MKLIKLSETHYIIVDDSEIKQGDWAIHLTTKNISQCQEIGSYYGDWKKIIRSTEILSEECKRCTGTCKQCVEHTKISLSEVEEAISDWIAPKTEWEVEFVNGMNKEEIKLKIITNEI